MAATRATTPSVATVPLREPLFRGPRRLRIALVGLPNSGKSTFFAAVASTSVQRGALAGTRSAYDECAVQIGLDEARVIDLPSIRSPHHFEPQDRAALKYLLWGEGETGILVYQILLRYWATLPDEGEGESEPGAQERPRIFLMSD